MMGPGSACEAVLIGKPAADEAAVTYRRVALYQAPCHRSGGGAVWKTQAGGHGEDERPLRAVRWRRTTSPSSHW